MDADLLRQRLAEALPGSTLHAARQPASPGLELYTDLPAQLAGSWPASEADLQRALTLAAARQDGSLHQATITLDGQECHAWYTLAPP